MKIFCKICNKKGDSSRSHLTPKSFTNKSEHLSINTKTIKASRDRGSGMPFDINIICQNCEKYYFNDIDRKFSLFIKDIEGSSEKKKYDSDLVINPEVYRVRINIDYGWLDTFCASLLYRHSLSDRQSLSLGRYESVAKKMIEKYNNNESISTEQKFFSCFCIINTLRKASKNLKTKDITFYRNCGQRIYRFLAGSGLEIHIKVSNGSNLDAFSRFRDPECILALDWGDDFTKKIEGLVLSSRFNYK